MDMKKLIILLTWLLAAGAVSAQSELPAEKERRLPADNDQPSPKANYKEFGGFLLDMGLMSVLPPQLPKYDFGLDKLPKDYNQLFSLTPDVTFTQGLSNVFSSSYSGFGMFGFSSFGSTPQQLQMGSFKLKNGMRINTYGEYNSDGRRVRNPSALPWEKNNFKGAFEMKSANGAFGIRIEVQQGRNTFPY